MHIPDGWIDLPTSLTAGVVAAGTVAVAAKRAAVAMRDRVTTLPAVVAAYALVAQLLVIPVGLGTGTHLIGAALAALLVGPATAIMCTALVVVVQALLLADGGVTAMGLNLLNDGIIPALVGWGVWRALGGRSALAAGLAGGASSLAAGAAVALEFVVGGTDVVPPGTVAATVGGAHLLAAVAEGVLTAAVVRGIIRLRPDLLHSFRTRRSSDNQPVAAGEGRP